MKLMKDYECSGDYITYKISIGGHIQIRWRTPETRWARMLLWLPSQGSKPVTEGQLHANNNALMAVAWTAVKFLMESRRNRFPYEELDTYLSHMWGLTLEELNAVSLRSDYKYQPIVLGLTAKGLVESGVLAKMREGL